MNGTGIPRDRTGTDVEETIGHSLHRRTLAEEVCEPARDRQHTDGRDNRLNPQVSYRRRRWWLRPARRQPRRPPGRKTLRNAQPSTQRLTLANATTAPVLMSIPATSTTSICPSAASASGAACRRILLAFPLVANEAPRSKNSKQECPARWLPDRSRAQASAWVRHRSFRQSPFEADREPGYILESDDDHRHRSDDNQLIGRIDTEQLRILGDDRNRRSAQRRTPDLSVAAGHILCRRWPRLQSSRMQARGQTGRRAIDPARQNNRCKPCQKAADTERIETVALG